MKSYKVKGSIILGIGTFLLFVVLFIAQYSDYQRCTAAENSLDTLSNSPTLHLPVTSNTGNVEYIHDIGLIHPLDKKVLSILEEKRIPSVMQNDRGLVILYLTSNLEKKPNIIFIPYTNIRYATMRQVP